ncbi:MAG: hypothetical protein R3Y54_00815 [Eubacteriales bacterium]
MLELLEQLKERLEFSVLGSIHLIKQDFKLQKAIDEFAGIATSSKVFEKIYGLAKALVEKDCEDKASEILDLLALINAVILTQTVTTSGNKIQELNVTETEYIRISSKTMNAFYDAVYQSGSGRLDAVQTILQDKSLVNDYRIFQGILEGTKDRYFEMKDCMIDQLSQCDKKMIPYLKKLGETEEYDKMTMLYIVSKIGQGSEDEYLKGLYDELEKDNAKKRTKKNTTQQVQIHSMVTPNQDNFEFFSYVFRNSEEQLMATLKLIQMSERYHENYVNRLGEDVITYLTEEKGNKEGLPIIYSTDTTICDFLLDELEIEMKKEKVISNDESMNSNHKRYTLLFLGVNKPSERWFNTILLLLEKDARLFMKVTKSFAGDYTRKQEIRLIIELICEYVLLHREKVNEDFLEKVYGMIGEEKVAIEFVQDISKMSAIDLYDTYATYLKNPKTRSIGTSIFYTINYRIHYRDGQYYVGSVYEEAIGKAFYSMYTSRYDTYYQKAMEDEYLVQRGKTLFGEPLDPRWYATYMEVVGVVNVDMLFPQSYISDCKLSTQSTVTVKSYYGSIYVVRKLVQLMDVHYEKEIRQLTALTMKHLGRIKQSMYHCEDTPSRSIMLDEMRIIEEKAKKKS